MKKQLTMVLAVLMVLALCACGNKAAGNTGDTQAESETAAQTAGALGAPRRRAKLLLRQPSRPLSRTEPSRSCVMRRSP